MLVSASDVLPPLCNVIGVTTADAAATRGDFIRAILRGRRKAVEFMYAHPDEAAEIVAKAYNLDVDSRQEHDPQFGRAQQIGRALLGRRATSISPAWTG